MICGINDWGPLLWHIIHLLTILATMDKKNINIFKIFLKSLKYLLPCGYCRIHYIQNLNSYLINNNHWREGIFSERKNLIYSMILMHQKVNIQNNKNNHSIHYYYHYWLQKKKKKYILKLYIKNLEMCQNVPKNLLNIIKHIKLT